MKNKRLFYLMMLIMLPVTLFSEMNSAKSLNLVLWLKDRGNVLFLLDERPKTTFRNSDLIIETSNLSVSYPMSSVSHFTFCDVEKTDVINKKNERTVTFCQNGNDITIIGLPANRFIRVYTSDGRLLHSRQTKGRSNTTISLEHYPAGVYLIQADSITLKFLRQ